MDRAQRFVNPPASCQLKSYSSALPPAVLSVRRNILQCRRVLRCTASAGSFEKPEGSGVPRDDIADYQKSYSSSSVIPDNFCIIESRESIKDFANLGLAEIREQISSRRNKIYFLMEEVRRLRIQQRIKGGELSKEEELGEERYPSVVPFFPPLTDATIRDYANFYITAVSAIIVFGGVIAPVLEVRLGLGGTSYSDFIKQVHLPAQLAEVDPIVASFCGGAVGVLTTLLLLEANNAKVVAKNRCIYCGGTGYVTCGACGGKSLAPIPVSVDANGAKQPLATEDRCATCSGTGKVACIACLCTGKKVARESDPRLDPFA